MYRYTDENINAMIDQALELLQDSLPAHLTYHSPAHAVEVLNDAVAFAKADDVSERELQLIAIAAIYHDAGFIYQLQENEPVGAKMASEAMMKTQLFSKDEVAQVEKMILSTAFVKTETIPVRETLTPLAIYLMDADLGSLGRDDFFEKYALLINENKVNDEVKQKKFYQFTLLLFKHNDYQSREARRLLCEKKKDNYNRLNNMAKITEFTFNGYENSVQSF